jgi:hypothetical protein
MNRNTILYILYMTIIVVFICGSMTFKIRTTKNKKIIRIYDTVTQMKENIKNIKIIDIPKQMKKDTNTTTVTTRSTETGELEKKTYNLPNGKSIGDTFYTKCENDIDHLSYTDNLMFGE